MKVSSLWDDVEELVICIDDMISLVHQIHSVAPPVIPYIHHNIAIYLHSAFHLQQAPPHPYALPLLPQVTVILVNKLPVLVRVILRVFIRSYMHLRSIKPGKKLIPDGIQKSVSVGILQVKKLLRVFLTREVWPVLRERQCMCRRIDFWRNRHSICFRNRLQFAHILSGVGSIFGGQPREAVAIETERRVFLHPILTHSSIDLIVVEMKLEVTHLVP